MIFKTRSVFIDFSFRSVYGEAQIRPKTQMIFQTYTVRFDWAQSNFLFQRFQLVAPASKLLSPSLVSKPYFCQMYSVENQLQVYLLGVRK